MAQNICKLDFVREDDYVEYFIFPLLPDDQDGDNGAEQEQLLHEFQTLCVSMVERLVKKCEYIWHKDAFNLQMRTSTPQEQMLCEESTTNRKEVLPPHLHGVTHFGENIADEWFIVHLLYEVTRELKHCIARVIDADGEFLLIEAADTLPKWANPDTCEQRVYIFDGHLQLVQNSPSNTAKLISVDTAISKIRSNLTLYRVSDEIQKCISERLKEFRDPYCAGSNSAIHRQIVHLPLGVAALLQHRPALIAAAVRAFCERDTRDMKACRAMRFFPPEQRVRTNVRFTRCLYAMIMHSNYIPDRTTGWALCGDKNTEAYKEDLLGIKIACGFEILAAQAKPTLDDEEKDTAWRAYIKSLTAKGYFRDNLEGSQAYQKLYKEARQYYIKNRECFQTIPRVGNEVVELLKTININAEEFRKAEGNNLQPSDPDDWLSIDSDQLDAMLTERFGIKKLYKSNGDINADEFTKNLTEFLEKQSEFDGIDDQDSDDDDDENDSDEPSSSSKQKRSAINIKKNYSMRKACNRNPVIAKNTNGDNNTSNSNATSHVRDCLNFVIPEDNWDSNSEMSDFGDDDDLEHNIDEMGEPNTDADIKRYMSQMDKELANTSIGQTFGRKQCESKTSKSSNIAVEDDFDDIESFQPININVNTLKNMMDSYKSQLGGAGPASNLLNAMGVGMSNAARKDSDLSESAV